MAMKKMTTAFIFIILLWLIIFNPSANAFFPIHGEEENIIYIDPLRNQLTLVLNGVKVKQYPVALGKRKTPSPVGEWKVINKYENWGKGFGTRWIGLNVPWGIYGIHGTNRPGSIGSDASHGCIRMFNRHVEELYKLIPLGTRVYILGHPLGEPYMEPRSLANGDTGADVMLIQSRLKSAGYYSGPTNGKFGPATQRALEKFERDYNLPRDGIINRHDYEALGLLE